MITDNDFRWEGYSFFSDGILRTNLARLTRLCLVKFKIWLRQQVLNELYVELLPDAHCLHPPKFIITNSIPVPYYYPGAQPCQF